MNTTTMRERFKNSWGDFLADEALIQIGDFIEQELKKEREEIVENIEVIINAYTDIDDYNTESVMRGLSRLINTIKNRV